MAERFKAPVLKTGEGSNLPWVRIPLCPPLFPGPAVARAVSIRTMSEPSPIDEQWMHHALALAERAQREFDEIPVGAALVSADGVLNMCPFNKRPAIYCVDDTARAEKGR